MSMNEQMAEKLEGIGTRDHSLGVEYRIFGPPGTGKTSSVAHLVGRAVDRLGPECALVTSFTRAAAAEIAGHNLSISPGRVGTVHSHCYRVLGGPAIAEAHVTDWNRKNPELAITPVRSGDHLDGEDDAEAAAESGKGGDRLLQELNRYRGLMTAREAWPIELRQFAAKWERYKRENNLSDFTDLIETCLRDTDAAPGRPNVIFVDEAQDHTPMQMDLIRRWGAYADYFVVVGDDDQLLFSWCGASPESLLKPVIPDDQLVVLEESLRVPRAIHAFAEKLIGQVSRRQPKVYRPRPAPGEVHHLSRGGYRSPEYTILKTAEQHLARGKTVMFLATCAYMLRPILAVLRKNAIPFHNPYRKSNGFWNPLRVNHQGSAASRVLALLAPHDEGTRRWTYGELLSWSDALRCKGTLRPGAMDVMRDAGSGIRLTPAALAELFEPAALQSLLAASDGDPQVLLAWWRARVTPEFHRCTQFAADIAKRRGPKALWEKPRAIVGTIHSVKGGQADVVYLFPDLSPSGDAQYQRTGPARDSVIRVFYVGATRARETLYICSGESAMAVSI